MMWMQLMQPSVQKSRITTRPRSDAIETGFSTLNHCRSGLRDFGRRRRGERGNREHAQEKRHQDRFQRNGFHHALTAVNCNATPFMQ